MKNNVYYICGGTKHLCAYINEQYRPIDPERCERCGKWGAINEIMKEQAKHDISNKNIPDEKRNI